MTERTLPAAVPGEEVTVEGSSVDEAAVRRMHQVVRLLDDGLRLPVVGIRVGADPLLGLVPVVGDVLPALFGLYVVAEAWRLGASRSTLLRMLVNLALDAVVGSVPVVGDLFDIGYRAHRRNLDLVLEDLELTVTT